MGDLPHVSLTSEPLFGVQVVVASAYVTKKQKQVRHAEQVFRGFDEKGQGHGRCRRVEGDMGHRRTCGLHRRERNEGRSKGKRGEKKAG